MQNAAGAMFGVDRLGEAVAANRTEDPETLVRAEFLRRWMASREARCPRTT